LSKYYKKYFTRAGGPKQLNLPYNRKPYNSFTPFMRLAACIQNVQAFDFNQVENRVAIVFLSFKSNIKIQIPNG